MHHLSRLRPVARGVARCAAGPGARNRAVMSGAHRPGRSGVSPPAGSGRGRRDAFRLEDVDVTRGRMSALGSSLQVVYERWHEWAVRQRDFISNGRPGITAEESDTVARRFGKRPSVDNVEVIHRLTGDVCSMPRLVGGEFDLVKSGPSVGLAVSAAGVGSSVMWHHRRYGRARCCCGGWNAAEHGG